MLYEILKAQGAESCVDEIERDANGADALTFACTEKSLPFPMTAEMRGALGLVPFEKDFNREILRVRNLKNGRYAVKIDGTEVGVWTAAELAEGVNLALNEKTPQYRQAAEAAKICQKLWAGERMLRNFATRRRWMRMHYKIDPDAPGAVESLLEKLLAEGKSEDSYEVRTYREYLKNWPRHAEFEAAVVKDRAALAEAVRPRGHEFKIEADARIEMGAPFTDGAILQRGMSVPVWGRVAPRAGVTGAPSFEGRKVKVSFAGQEKTAAVGADGKWKVVLDPMAASKESRTMKVCELGVEHGEELEIKDVLVGEVWFASGQSNMECPIWGSCARYRDMKGGFMTAMTRLPNVRYVKCERKWSAEPVELSATWRKFTPEGLLHFNQIATHVGGGDSEEIALSAVAFYYARELYLALDVPIGIVDVSWGGSNIDAWIPKCGYDGCPASIQKQQTPGMYNGMVAAFAPMAVRGMIWYQGEANRGRAEQYIRLQKAYVEMMRNIFEVPDAPFYFVQIAPYPYDDPDGWTSGYFTEAQAKSVNVIPNSGMAATLDIGEFGTIHPCKKQEVGNRLAYLALVKHYGIKGIDPDAPAYESVEFEDGKAIVKFKVADRSLSPAGVDVEGFEIAGADKVFHPAVGHVQNWGDKVIVSSPDVPNPVAVRYCFRNWGVGTLFNNYGIPVAPFRTDNWNL